MSHDPRPTLGWIEGREHRLPLRVYYEDTDFTGVVYHGQYARFFERGRSEFLRLCGIGHAELLARPQPLAFSVIRLEIDFRRSARIDDELLVRTTYDEAPGARLVIGQRLTRGEEEIAAARVEVVCIGLDGRARRPPADLVAALRPFFR